MVQSARKFMSVQNVGYSGVQQRGRIQIESTVDRYNDSPLYDEMQSRVLR